MGFIQKVGGGAVAGAFWVGDLLNLPDARTAVLAADPGAYIDVFIGSVAIANFICRVQHQLFGSTHHAKVISPFYASRLGAYDNSVLDLTSAAELEIISGSLATWAGGITTAGDYEFIHHFIGAAYGVFRDVYMQCLISDATPTAADNSSFGAGLIDTAAKGTGRFFGAGGYILSADDWQNARMIDSIVARTTSTSANIWTPANMPTSPSRVTVSAQTISQLGGTHGTISGHVRPHGADAKVGAAPSVGANSLFPATSTAYGSGVFSAGSTTIDVVIEAIFAPSMQVPAPGY